MKNTGKHDYDFRAGNLTGTGRLSPTPNAGTPAGCLITHGLADAVKTIAERTGLGAKVYADHIPFEGNSFELGRKLDVDPVSAAMNGGEDYQLLYVVPIQKLDLFRHDFQTFEIIGHLAQPEVGTVLVTPEGVELPLRAQGWNDNEQ